MTDAATLQPWTWNPTARDDSGAARSAEQIARQRMDRDRELVERCLNGSEHAWEQLVRSHSRLVYGACYRFTGRADEAHDLTQEVFLRVFRSLHTYKVSAGAFRTWLVKLTRNLLIDHYRRTKKEQKVDPLDERIHALEETAGLGGRADRTLRSREAGEMLQYGLSRLSPELREAVILRDLQEMEYREIAESLGIPEGTVKSRINRGRRELARRLRPQGAAS
jgi:RNA polymerase sigma-70 factor (ECF subfamily)